MQVLLHPSDQPVFRLAGCFSGCRVELRVNDVPLLRENNGAAFDMDLALNEWIFQGVNTFEIRVMPPADGASFPCRTACEMRLLHKTARGPVRHAVEIDHLRWSSERESTTASHTGHGHETMGGMEESDGFDLPEELDSPLLAVAGQMDELHWHIHAPRIAPDKSVRLRALLPLPPPWPACPWQRSDVLTENKGTRHAVLDGFRKLHSALKAGNWHGLFMARRAAVQAAYYLGGDEVDEALGFPRLLQRADWQLLPLDESHLALEYAGDGKITRLLDAGTGQSPLVLWNQATHIMASIDAWWTFNNQWTLVR